MVTLTTGRLGQGHSGGRGEGGAASGEVTGGAGEGWGRKEGGETNRPGLLVLMEIDDGDAALGRGLGFRW